MKKERFEIEKTDTGPKCWNWKIRCGMSGALAVTLLGTQFWECGTFAWADTGEWEGTTQISTQEQYPNLDASAVSLVIEEVYVETGSYAKEGQSILKITEESYQEALDYYTAAILYAQNDLVSAQMDYDIAMREAESSLELARAEALQAEFTKDQHIKELEDTIKEHEEILEEVEAYIEEIEENVEAGTYTSSSSSSASSTGSSSTQKNSSSGKENSTSKEQRETESEQETGDDKLAETEEEIPLETGAETESEAERETENVQETEPETAAEQLSVLNEQIQKAEQTLSELENEAEKLQDAIEEKNTAYNALLKKMYELLDLSTDDLCGAGNFLLLNGESDRLTQSDQILEEEQESVAGTIAAEQVKTFSAEDEDTESFPKETAAAETKAAETKAAKETETKETETVATQETQAKEAESAAAKETTSEQTESAAAESIIEDSQGTETSIKESVMEAMSEKTALEETGNIISETGESQTETSAEKENQGKTADTEADQSTETETDQEETESEETETLDTLLVKLHAMEAERTILYEQLETLADALELAKKELEGLKEQKLTLLESSQKETEDPDGENTGKLPGEAEGSSGENSEIPDGSEGNTGTTGAFPNESAGTTGENSGLPDQTEGTTGTTSAFPSGASGSQNGTVSGITGSADSTQNSGSGFISGGSASMGASGTGTAIQSGSAQTSAAGGMDLGGMSEMENAESLFGSTYDLSSVEKLLEQEPSSEDEAEELLEKLEEALETVQEQYEELIREEKITRLEIQYTYDTAVIAGKLAEITYQQEVEELENTLWEAQNQVTELQEDAKKLETWENGEMPAGAVGMIASVNYEAGDVINNSLAVYSVYQTDVVTVTLEVSQYDIAQFCVGDTVEVTLSNYGTAEGTITEKTPEASENSTRTSVNYEVEVSIDNSSGRLSSGVAATVSREVAENE